jgi:hypothetical protein
MWLYERHNEAVMERFRREKRFPCISVGRLVSVCNRRNYYDVKDMYDGVDQDYGADEIIRMTMGQMLHDSIVLSDHAEWHLVYEDVYGHVDEYFPDMKILIEKKTTMDAIDSWKQTLDKVGGTRFKWLPGPEWENQLRYYALLLQKGTDVKSGKPANENGETMVKKCYVVYYKPDAEYMFAPMIIPVPMIGDKWNMDSIEEEMINKKTEIETCMKENTMPLRYASESRCPRCPYLLRCFGRDKVKKGEIPEEIRLALGKRSPLAKAQEMVG